MNQDNINKYQEAETVRSDLWSKRQKLSDLASGPSSRNCQIWPLDPVAESARFGLWSKWQKLSDLASGPSGRKWQIWPVVSVAETVRSSL